MQALVRFRFLPAIVASLTLFSALVRTAAAQTTIYTPYDFSTVAGIAGSAGSANGTGTAAQFYRPYAVAVDTNGNLYVADTLNQTIRKIAPGGVVTTLAGSPGTAGATNGTGGAATFRSPAGVAVDSGGNVYVADEGNDLIRKITPGGVVTTLAGSAEVTGSADGTGVLAKFNGPFGIAADGSGNLYVSDTANDTVREVTAAGVVTTLAGLAGVPGYADGTGAAARFSSPGGVAVDTNGNIYVADTLNERIREVAPGGVVTTLAGSTSGYGDGVGTAAQFNTPRGVAVDTAGNVYVADTSNDEIRKVTPGGVVRTLAGFGSGSSNGVGENASFNAPYGAAVDGSGTVYVADSNNDEIRSGFFVLAPTFTLNASPAAIAVAGGRTAVFNAIATGSPAPTYQWKFNGSTTIPGAANTTDPILMVSGATASSAGTYTCTASNLAGSVSSSATLSVTSAAGTPGYLTNLSGRGLVGSGLANGVFAGFGITGTGSKQLLIRGMGPGLYTFFQLSGYLADPLLTLYNSSSTQINQNGPWGGTQALINAENAVGAFPVPTNSLDAMLYLPISVGNYSAEVSGVNGSTGIALAEIYDADAAPPAARLNNISVRTPVGTGSNILFGGFVIGGSTGETVLIRAIGPSLTPEFGLAGTLAQPVLTLYSGSNAIYSNTVWGGDPVLASVENTVGAYSISPTSQDSLLLVTLPPGSYSAQIQGVNSTTGIATVEIYEVY